MIGRGTLLRVRYFWGPMVPYGIGTKAFTTAGRAWLIPIDVPHPVTIDRIIYQVGTLNSGNVRLGVYREGTTPDSPAGAALVVESASVAQAVADAVQMVTIADTRLEPGQYFLGVQGSDVGGHFLKSDDIGNGLAYYYDRAGGYGAFTDPCPAVTAVATIAWMGVRVKDNHPIGGRMLTI